MLAVFFLKRVESELSTPTSNFYYLSSRLRTHHILRSLRSEDLTCVRLFAAVSSSRMRKRGSAWAHAPNTGAGERECEKTRVGGWIDTLECGRYVLGSGSCWKTIPHKCPVTVIRVRNWEPLQTALELKQMCISWVNRERIPNFHFDAQRKLTILGEKIGFDKAAFMFNIPRYN
jgi:hypothetical protein